MTATEDANTALVLEAFDTLFNRRDYSGAEAFWSPDYIQHSAHIAPGRDGLFDLVKALPAELRYEHQLAVATGDHVILHGRFSGHGQPANWIVADIVRIADGKLAEHWDVIQDEAHQTQSVSGLPMFGETFPATPPPAPPSLLLRAFVEYLRARPTVVDIESTFECAGRNFQPPEQSRWRAGGDHRAAGRGNPSAPSCTTTAAATSVARHRTGTCRWPAPWRLPRTPGCTPSITAWLRHTAFPRL